MTTRFLTSRAGGVVAIALLALTAGCERDSSNAGVPRLTATYHAVLLSNGQVYFGKLEGLGTRFPVLHDVFYVQTGVDPQTKENKSILLKRGSEWHSPDHMILNGAQILLIEPVGPQSRVAQLIAQALGH